MGLFESKDKKLTREVAKMMAQSRRTGNFVCYYCGRPQRITYYGNNDTWTCPSCKTKNSCG